MKLHFVPESTTLIAPAAVNRYGGGGLLEAALRVTLGIAGLVVAVAASIGIVTWRAVDRRVDTINFHNELLRNDARLRDAVWEFQEYLDIHSHGGLEEAALAEAWKKCDAELGAARDCLGAIKRPGTPAGRQYLAAAKEKFKVTEALARAILASAEDYLLRERPGELSLYWHKLHQTLYKVEPAVDDADRTFELAMRAFAAESGFSVD